MLNNEKAALATVSRLYKSLKSAGTREFIDTDFGPNLSSGPDPFDVEGIEEKR